MSREALEASANEVAEYANQCCHRSDGYEEDVAALVLAKLQAAQADAFERSAKVCEESAAAYGGIAEGPIATDYGKMVHEAMAVGASNCATIIRALAKEAGNG